MLDEYEDDEEYEDESDLDERESYNLEWAEEVEDSGVWKEHLFGADEELLKVKFSRWEQLHFVCRGFNYPECNSKRANRKYYKET